MEREMDNLKKIGARAWDAKKKLKNASGLNGFQVMETGSVVLQLENRPAHVAMHNVADNTEANPAKRHTAHVTVIK